MAKKIKVIRASGLPVEIEQLKAYKDEYRDIVDRSRAKCGYDMLRMQKLLARIDRIFAKKYTLISEWEQTNSAKKWRERIDQYGNIMIAAARDDKTIVYVIMDDQEVL